MIRRLCVLLMLGFLVGIIVPLLAGCSSAQALKDSDGDGIPDIQEGADNR